MVFSVFSIRHYIHYFISYMLATIIKFTRYASILIFNFLLFRVFPTLSIVNIKQVCQVVFDNKRIDFFFFLAEPSWEVFCMQQRITKENVRLSSRKKKKTATWLRIVSVFLFPKYKMKNRLRIPHLESKKMK